jgi:protoheme IX farnesyltransferase
MLPSVVSFHTTAVRILLYTVLLWALTLVFGPVAGMGAIYVVAALILGAIFTLMAVQLLRTGDSKRAMPLFAYSITYISLLFGAMMADQLIRSGLS